MKRGQSEVVAIVLIILLIVAIVSIVGTIVFNLARDSTNFDSADLDLRYNNEDTFYYSSGEEVYVSVSRGSDDVALSALKINVYTGTDIRSCIRRNVPGANEQRTYKLLGFPFIPDFVEVIPALTDEEKFIDGLGKIVVESQSSPYVFEESEFGGSCGDEDIFPSEPESIDNL